MHIEISRKDQENPDPTSTIRICSACSRVVPVKPNATCKDCGMRLIVCKKCGAMYRMPGTMLIRIQDTDTLCGSHNPVFDSMQ